MPPCPRARVPAIAFACALAGLLGWVPAHGADMHDALRPMVQGLVERQPAAGDAGAARGALRVEVEVGRLDERLRLAPCHRIEPLWPAGQRPWGRIRVGLRCVDGPTPWKVYLPVTVKVWGRALVAAEPLAAGSTVEPGHFVTKEVDLAQGSPLPLPPTADIAQRVLARALPAGTPLREADLRLRQWFAAGDVVQVVALGAGYQVVGEGTAIDPGLEGQRARVRTESGRIVVGHAVAGRRIEVRP